MSSLICRSMIASLLAAVCVLDVATSTGFAQDAPPVYSRMRRGADDWHARGGSFGYSFPSYMYGGFFPPFGPPIVVTGSYYQRPYPAHFEFARTRWGGAPSEPSYQQEMAPRSDCPCANDVTPTPAE